MYVQSVNTQARTARPRFLLLSYSSESFAVNICSVIISLISTIHGLHARTKTTLHFSGLLFVAPIPPSSLGGHLISLDSLTSFVNASCASTNAFSFPKQALGPLPKGTYSHTFGRTKFRRSGSKLSGLRTRKGPDARPVHLSVLPCLSERKWEMFRLCLHP